MTFEDIIKKYKFKIRENVEPIEKNSMYIAFPDLWIGNYDNEEYKMISLYHELGHNLINKEFIEKWNYSTLVIELECWNLGIEQARLDGVLFSDEALCFAYNTAMTYKGHDEREYANWKETHSPYLWVNKSLTLSSI